MRGRGIWGVLLRIAVVAVVVAACGPIGGESFIPGSEQLPAPGYFHIVGDPPVAARTLVFRYVGSDGVVSQVSDTIRVGEQVVVDRTTLPGSHGLTLNDVTCTGSFNVETDRETDLVVHITSDGCATSVERVHQAGEITH